MPPLRIWVAQITGLPASMQLGAGTGWDFDFAAPCKSMGKSMEILLNARNVHCENNAHPSAPHPPPSKGFAKAAIRDSLGGERKVDNPRLEGVGLQAGSQPTASWPAHSPLPPPLFTKKNPSGCPFRCVIAESCIGLL